MNDTKLHSTKSRLSKFKKHHFRAIELRYEGKTYLEIALQISTELRHDFKEQTVKWWFMKNGILEDLYIDYARKENDRRRQLIIEELKKLVPLIPKKYNEILNRNISDLNPAQLTSYFSVVRQTLKDLCEILDFKVESGESPDDPLDRYFARAEEELGVRNRPP